MYQVLLPVLPGKITVRGDFSLENTGVYKAEILNKDHYDQIVAHDVYIDAQSKLDFDILGWWCY